MSQKQRRRFTISFKLKVVNTYLKNKNYTLTARKFNLTRKMVRNWVKNFENLKEVKHKLEGNKNIFNF